MPRKKPMNTGRVPSDLETVPAAEESRPGLPEKLLEADPDGSETAKGVTGAESKAEAERIIEASNAQSEKLLELERNKLLKDMAATRALNEEAVAAEVAAANDAIAEQIAALTVDELVQGVDLALENMAAGLTQSEAVRQAAETIKGEKVAPPQE